MLWQFALRTCKGRQRVFISIHIHLIEAVVDDFCTYFKGCGSEVLVRAEVDLPHSCEVALNQLLTSPGRCPQVVTVLKAQIWQNILEKYIFPRQVQQIHH